jgi:hypothetical protein
MGGNKKSGSSAIEEKESHREKSRPKHRQRKNKAAVEREADPCEEEKE